MESLNIQLQPFFEWLVRTTVQAGVLICLILLVQLILGGRLGVRWRYCLWLVLLIRMAMPWAPQSRASLFNLIPQSVPQRQTEYSRAEVSDDTFESDVAGTDTTEPAPVSTTGVPQDTPEAITPMPEIRREAGGQLKAAFFEVANILPLVWVAGALVLAVYVCANNFNLLRIVKRERPLTDQKILDLLEDCKAEMGIRIILGIVATDKVKSPALFGFIRPRLLLPKGMVEALGRQELRYVFLHELAHLKRYDIYLGWLMSLLQVLHWFNPLIWLAFYRLRADRELACDALVLARTQSSQAKDYGRTIVNLLERFSRSQRLPAMAGILETKTQLKRRIKMIAKFKKDSYRWSPLAVILIIILSCVSLPDAKRTKASETAAGEPARQPNFRKIRIPNRIRSDAQFSPDGKKIALVFEKKLWIMPRFGTLGPGYPGAPQLLNTGEIEVDNLGFTWSGDGQWIAFNNNQRIYIVSAEGGEPKQVHESDRDVRIVNYRMSLSPHGKSVAFSSVDDNKLHIYTISIDGGVPRQLTDSPTREPVFSPDGKTIAYVEDENLGRGGGGLWIVPADGGTPTRVANAGNASSPVWSPNGRMIAFIDYGMDTQIYIVPIGEDGKPAGEKVTIDCPEGIEGVRRLTGWTPDNEIGAIFKIQQEFALYTQPVQGGKATFVTHGGYPLQPRWSPDGRQIYHTNKVNEARGDWQGLAIAHVSAEGGDVTTVPIQSEAKIVIWGYGAGNHVSPDGNTIVFAGRKSQESIDIKHIWTLSIEGGKPKQLTDDPAPFTDWYPCWSSDGKAIAFLRGPTSENLVANIYIIPANGGEPKQLTSESDMVFSASTIAFSPDGELLAYFSRDETFEPDGTLKVIPVDGGEPRVVAKVQRIYANKEMAWSPDSEQIAFNEGNVIKVVSLKDGNIVDIEPDLKDTGIYHLDWSPDGERLVFAGNRGGDRELWVMENFLPGAPVAKPEPAVTLRRIEVRGSGRVHSHPSFDGKYMSDVDDTGNLVVRELATGKERKLTKKGSWSESKDFAHKSLISPDSARVAYLWFNTEKEDFDLRVVGFDGSDDRLLWGAEEGARSFNMDAWSLGVCPSNS